MLRLLTALLICVLMFSHGTMGNAAPHGAGVRHSHIGEHSSETMPDAGISDDHHSDAVDLEADTTESETQPNDSKAAEVAHAHAAADQVQASTTLPVQSPGGMQPTGLIVTPLTSASQPPLLEPPSA